MQSWKKIGIVVGIIIIFAVLIFAVAYYWFTYRPAKTRAFCDQVTRLNSIAPNEITPYQGFKDCMFKNGVMYP